MVRSSLHTLQQVNPLECSVVANYVLKTVLVFLEEGKVSILLISAGHCSQFMTDIDIIARKDEMENYCIIWSMYQN